MKLTFRSRWVSNIPEDELHYLLNTLTVRSKSGIREIIAEIDNTKLRSFVAYHRNKPVAWCVLECRQKYYAQVYVKKDYRGKGIGGLLLNRAYRVARSKNKRLLVAELPRSSGFFANMADKIKLFWHPVTAKDKTLAIKPA